MQPLQGWKTSESQWTANRAACVILAGVLAVCLCILLAILRAPYQRPSLQIAVLTPKVSPSTQITRRASFASSVDYWQTYTRDLAAMLCQASGQHISHSVQARLPQAWLELSGDSLTQQLRQLKDQLQQRPISSTHLVVYVSGVLSTDSQQPALCSRTLDAMHSGSELALLPLIDHLQDLACQQILLCIDVVPPANGAPAVMATPLLLEELSAAVERKLSVSTQKTPLAVCISVSSAQQLIENGHHATPLATAMHDALTAECDSGVFDLHRLEDQVTALTRDRDSCPDSIWLASLHWPATSELITLPNASLAKMDESASSPTLQATAISHEIKTLPDAEIDQFSDSQLWYAGQRAMDQLARSTATSERQLTSKWLPLPLQLSYRQRHPFAYAWMQHLWLGLTASERLGLDKPGTENLRDFVRHLIHLAQGRDVRTPTHESSPGGLRPTLDVQLTPTHSLLVNATLTSIEAIDLAVGTRSIDLLEQLTQAIDRARSGLEFQQSLAILSEGESCEWLELEQCRALSGLDLPWPVLQPILRLQLVAWRSDTELFQAEPDIHKLTMEAQQTWQQIMELVLSGQSTESNPQLKFLVDKALGLYHRALTRAASITQAAIQRHALISDALVHHPWTHMQGVSTKEVEESLYVFIAQWQHILDVSASFSEQLADDREPAAVLRQADRLLKQLTNTSIPRQQHIEAFEQLQRQLIHSAQSSLDASYFNSVSQLSTNGFTPGCAQLFLNLLATTQPDLPMSWIDRRLQQLIEANLRKAALQMQGATSLQSAGLESSIDLWNQLANDLDHQGIKIAERCRTDWSLTVDAPAAIDIERSDQAKIPCAISYERTNTARPEIQADYDDQTLQIELNNQILIPGQAVEVPVSSVGNTDASSETRPKVRVVLAVKRLSNQRANEPIRLSVSQGQEKRRAVIQVHVAQPSMVDVRLANAAIKEDLPASLPAQSPVLLLPNRQQAIKLWLTNRQAASQQLKVQVWGLDHTPHEIPEGTLSETAASEWLNRHPGLISLAQAQGIHIDPLTQQGVLLLPTAKSPEPKASVGLSGLMIGISDVHTKRMQLEYRPLHVRHPHDYIQHEVTVDAPRQSILALSQLREVNDTSTAAISYRLIEWPAGQMLAQSECQLSADAPRHQVELSSLRSRSDRIALITHIDGWPGAWVNVIDRGQHRLLDEPLAHIRLSPTAPEGIVPAHADSVAVELETWANFSPTDDETKLEIGWDRNQDRTLNAESKSSFHHWLDIRASYAAVDRNGALLLDSHVGPSRIVMPTTGLANQRASLLACLRHGDRDLVRSSATFVIDSQSPTVTSIRCAAQHSLHGVPAVFHIQVEDGGLAGVKQVAGAWSLDGRMQLSADMKPTEAVLRPDGSWTLTMPTAPLPQGGNLILIQATDRSGNCSETATRSIHLYSQAELDEQAAAITGDVKGWLMFARLPQSGLTVELYPEVDKQGAAAGGSDSQPLQPIASTTSLTDGSFHLAGVRMGKYTMRVRGILRGMRIERTRSILVSANRNAEPEVWRLDGQP